MKRLANINLILAIMEFWLLLNNGGNWINGIILTVVVWYNWETLKRLKGQPNKLHTLNLVIGAFNFIAGILLMFGGVLRVSRRSEFEHLSASMSFLGIIDLIFGACVLIFALGTIKNYRPS